MILLSNIASHFRDTWVTRALLNRQTTEASQRIVNKVLHRTKKRLSTTHEQTSSMMHMAPTPLPIQGPTDVVWKACERLVTTTAACCSAAAAAASVNDDTLYMWTNRQTITITSDALPSLTPLQQFTWHGCRPMCGQTRHLVNGWFVEFRHFCQANATRHWLGS